MRVFLTGGTGFIGQRLVRSMRARGWDIAVLVRDPQSAPAAWLARQGCKLVPGDVTRAAGLREAMAGIDLLLHNAGVYELGADAATARRMQQVNVQGTDIVLGAAHAAGVPRNIHVSTVWALGPTGTAPADETRRHDGNFGTAYERSKAQAHQVALQWRERGLPLVCVMPNGVMGANDHSAFGYFLRLFLLGGMPPIGFGGNTIYSFVDVGALAEGMCLAAEKALPGDDYLFCGEPLTIRELFAHWGRHGGGMTPLIWLPQWAMWPGMLLLEPLQRALRLTPFMSRDTLAASKCHLNYSAAKAQRNLGWSHSAPEPMWDAIIAEECALMARRTGFLEKLRHQPVVD